MRIQTLEMAVSEKAFRGVTIGRAAWFDWRHCHILSNADSAPGFTDFVLTRDGQLIFDELKSEEGTLTPASAVCKQRQVAALLEGN